jgi:hypothetical protein
MAPFTENAVMTNLLTSPVKQSPPEPATFTQSEAADFTRLSAKTLERHALAGEPVGRIKIGRRVVYLRSALEAWLVAKANPATIQTQNPAR